MKVLSLALIVIACWVVSPAYASPDGSLEDTPLVDAVKTAKAQPKIASLLDQLRAIKDEADFHEKGFDDYRRAKVWLLSAEGLRDFMSGQTDIAKDVRTAPQALIALAAEWQKTQGRDTEAARARLAEVEAAIAWKAGI